MNNSDKRKALVASAILNKEPDQNFVAKHFGGPGSGRYPKGSGEDDLQKEADDDERFENESPFKRGTEAHSQYMRLRKQGYGHEKAKREA